MNYQINDYYDYFFPGDQYQALSVISTIELVGYIVGSLVFETFRRKRCTYLYVLSYAICLIGAIGVLINDREEFPYVDMICNFFCKFGIAIAF